MPSPDDLLSPAACLRELASLFAAALLRNRLRTGPTNFQTSPNQLLAAFSALADRPANRLSVPTGLRPTETTNQGEEV